MTIAMATNAFSMISASQFAASAVPPPVETLVNNAEMFGLEVGSFANAISDGIEYAGEYVGTEKYDVHTRPAMWAFATVDNANAAQPEHVRKGVRLLEREMSPLEYDYGLESRIVIAGDRITVGAREFQRRDDAVEYVERWRDVLRVIDILPRAFDPKMTVESSYGWGGGYIQHIPTTVEAFREAYRSILGRYLGGEGVEYFLSKRYGPASDRAHKAYPLGIPACRLVTIDSMLREWSPATWRGGQFRSPKVDREWPYVIRGGYLFINAEMVKTAEQLHAIL